LYWEAFADGARGGDRTHDIQNHNLALLPTELHAPQNYFSLAKGALAEQRVSTAGKETGSDSPYSPARFHISSTRRFTSAGIVSTSGQRRVNPSDAIFFVASMPILEP